MVIWNRLLKGGENLESSLRKRCLNNYFKVGTGMRLLIHWEIRLWIHVRINLETRNMEGYYWDGNRNRKLISRLKGDFDCILRISYKLDLQIYLKYLTSHEGWIFFAKSKTVFAKYLGLHV